MLSLRTTVAPVASGRSALLRVIVASLALAAPQAWAATTFVTPLPGSQLFGPQRIEIRTDITGVDRVDFLVDGALAGVARKAPFQLAHDFGTSTAARTITARVWSAGYRQSETATVVSAGVTASDSIDVDVVEVPVRLRGRTVARADLRVRENGREQTITRLLATRPPAHFAFVVDRSSSMNGGRLEAAVAAVQGSLSRLRDGDSASIIFFNHQVSAERELRSPTIGSMSDVSRVRGSMVPSGGTSLRDALASIQSTRSTYAIAITDGGDRNSVLSSDAAARRLLGTRTSVHALVLGDSQDAGFLERAARESGGSHARTTREGLSSALSSLIDEINSRYLLVYQSSGSARGWRSVEVSSRRAAVTVRDTRKRYFAP